MPDRPRAGASPIDRSARVLPALLVAILVLIVAVAPVHAVDPTPEPSPSDPVSPSPTVTPSPTVAPSPTPTVTPQPTPSGQLPASFVISGRGYGHGVGMSQYGARGRALAGQTAPAILGHYFRGTTLGTISTATQVRVLVLANYPATVTSPLRIYGRGTIWRVDGIDKTFPADAYLRVWRSVEGGVAIWRIRVTAASGAQLDLRRVSGPLTVRPAASGASLQLYSKPGVNDRYRGTLRILMGTKATVVNATGLESYLRGVVPMEMPSSWPAEALKAQAIAARSYAAKRLHPTTGSYDLYDDTRSQVYGGINVEKATTYAAIAATAGVVVKSGSAIANTFFHSTGGGATEHNENAWVASDGDRVAGPVSYLRGSADVDPSGKAYDAAAPYATWKTASLTPARLQALLAADARTSVGTLTAVVVSVRGISGRAVKVTITGSSGTKTVSGEVFRSVVNKGLSTAALIRSTAFYVTATG